MDQVLNNREIATAILFLVIAGWVLSRREVRISLRRALEAIFSRAILITFTTMIVYVGIIVFVLYSVHFWDTWAIKGTVLWIVGLAPAMLLRANTIGQEEKFFRTVVLDNVKLVAVLEFLSNAYVFSLWAELLLVPFVTAVVLTNTVAELKFGDQADYTTVRKLLSALVGVIGLVLIAIALYRAIDNADEFATFQTLGDFALPILLSVLYLPFIYGWALILAYERLFARIRIHNQDRQLALYLKRRVLVTFHIRLWRLLRWSKHSYGLHLSSREDATLLLRDNGGYRA